MNHARAAAVRAALLLALGFGAATAPARAASPYGGGPQVITGAIYKQGLVLEEGAEGRQVPVFAEYHPDSGAALRTIDELDGGDRTLAIRNGADYAAARAALLAWRDNQTPQLLDQLVVLSRADYEASELATLERPYANTRSLWVFDPQRIAKGEIALDGRSPIARQSGFDIDTLLREAEPGQRRSLVLDDAGRVLHRSDNNIGYRVAYVQPDGEISADERTQGYDPYQRRALLAPVRHAYISNGLSLHKSGPNEEGFYESHLSFPPCPGFTHHYTVPMTAEVPYKSFNPQRQGSFNHYYFSSLSGYTCVGAPFYSPQPSALGLLAQTEATAIYAQNQRPPVPAHFRIDVTALSGSFVLANSPDGPALPVGERSLREQRQQPTRYQRPERADFNGDGEDDHLSELGSIALPVGAPATAPPRYGVWFSLAEDQAVDAATGVPLDDAGELIAPDLIKIARAALDDEAVGLLSAVGREDLFDTDLYVFRESSGQLVVEKSPFAPPGGNSLNGVDESGLGFFELTIPGRDGRHSTGWFNRHSAAERYEDWQATQFVNADFQGETDSLRAGEPLRVVLINRATGYVGSARTSVQSIDGAGGGLGLSLGRITLSPPNLKVHAERRYRVERGLTAGEQRRYTVASEGASLASDQVLSIATEWLDADGGPLPAQLPGMSGRLARLSGDRVLQAAVAHFGIEPGRHTEVIELGDEQRGANYLYVHVVGAQDVEAADFGTAADTRDRPERFVPVRVALYDAEASAVRRAALIGDEDYAPSAEGGLIGDAAVHRWVYRPEMMISQYELDVSAITRSDESGEEHELIDAATPVIAGGDTQLAITQELLSSEHDPLELFGPDSHLVYSLGGNEQQVGTGQGSYSITDFGSVGQIEGEDLLALNLLNSLDGGNVLWEWALSSLTIYPSDGGLEPQPLSADDVEGLGYFAYSPGAGGDSQVVTWVTQGTSSVSPVREQRSDGAFSTVIDASPVSGTEVRIRAQLDGGADVPGASYVIVPGQPADIALSSYVGEIAVHGVGSATAQFTVRDRHGNTVADGTPVAIEAPGLRVQGDSVTTDGNVTLRLWGLDAAGDVELVVRSAQAQYTRTVTVHDIDLAIAAPATVIVGQTLDVQITATSSYGVLPDFPIEVSGLRVALDGYRHRISGGVLKLSLPVGDFLGEGWLFAQFGDTIDRHRFNVIANPAHPVSIDTQLLVEDATSDGSVMIEGAELRYRASGTVTATGAPGDAVSARLGTWLKPPVAPELSLPMIDPHFGRTINDKIMGAPAEPQGDIQQRALGDPRYPRGYAFSRGDALQLSHGRLQHIDELGLVVRARFDQLDPDDPDAGTDRVVLSYAPLGFELLWTTRDTLLLRVQADNGLHQIESDRLNPDQLYAIGAHLVDNELVLQVDESITRSGAVVGALSNRAGEPLRIGVDLRGALSGLKIYDWSSEPTLLIDGGNWSSATVGADGKAQFSVRPNAAALSQFDQRWRRYAQRAFPHGQTALANSDCNATDGPPVDPTSEDLFAEAIGQAEAFARYLADCELLPQIRETIVTIESDAGAVSLSMASIRLAGLSTLYAQTKASEIALAAGPDCARGIITGEADGLGGITCDLVTSLFLVGDVRDFAYHTWWLYWETENARGELKYDRAVHILAGMGIATTIAELSGVGIALDAAIAGCKTAAKLMKGSPYPLAMASYLDRKLEGAYLDVDRIDAVASTTLPMLQLTAAVVLLKDDYQDVYRLISSIDGDDIDGLVSYARAVIERQLVAPVDLATISPDPARVRWALLALAALDRGDVLDRLDSNKLIQGLIKVLDDTYKFMDDSSLKSAGLSTKQIDNALKRSLRALGEALDSDAADLAPAIEQLIANDRVLGALMTAYDVSRSSDEGIKQLMRFACTKSTCDLGGLARTAADGPQAMIGFMEQIAQLSKRRAADAQTFSEEAWDGLGKVIEQIGRRTKALDKPVLRVSRAAAEVVAAINKLADEHPGIRFTRIELPKEPIFAGDGKKFIAHRQMDIEAVLPDGRTIKWEIKSWDPALALGEEGRLIKFLEGKPNKDGELVGQFRNDLIEMIVASTKLEVLDENSLLVVDPLKVTKRWRFDGRMEAAGITKEDLKALIRKKFAVEDFRDGFITQLKHNGLKFKSEKQKSDSRNVFDGFTAGGGDLDKLLDVLFEIPKMP